MAFEPSLWGTLPKELLHLVLSRLPVAGIGQLRILSKEWKQNIDCKDSEFNRILDATTHLRMFALFSQSWDVTDDKTLVNLYNVQADKWHAFETHRDSFSVCKASAADGGLYCDPRQWSDGGSYWDPWQSREVEVQSQLVVVNPFTYSERKLPPLLSIGCAKSDVEVKMAQLTVDKTTKEYQLHVVFLNTRTGGHFAQVYDSHINGWSVVEPGEGRIIGWGYSPTRQNGSYPLCPCVYSCADRNLQHFHPSDIAPALTEVHTNCIELINDHFFVLHKEAPAGSTNRMQDGERNSGKYCISEFHLPEKATAWVKLGVHECDPSMFDSTEEDYELSLLACNGFLLVYYGEYDREGDPVWLYDLSTCAWRNLPELGLPWYCNMVLCEISWNALP